MTITKIFLNFKYFNVVISGWRSGMGRGAGAESIIKKFPNGEKWDGCKLEFQLWGCHYKEQGWRAEQDQNWSELDFPKEGRAKAEQILDNLYFQKI